MPSMQRWMTVAVAALAFGAASPAWTQSCEYFFEEPPPSLPEAPQTQTTFQQALQNLASELAARAESQSSPGPLGPTDFTSSSRQIGFQSVSAGEVKAGQGLSPVSDFQQAVKSFQDAIGKNPNDMAAHRGLLRAQSGIVGYNILKGNLDSVARDLDHAEEGAIAALKKAPNDPGLLHLLGNLMATKATRPGLSDEDRAKAFQAAKSYYERAAAAGNIFSQYALGMLYLAMNDLPAAQKELRAFQGKITDPPPGLARALDGLDRAIKAQPTPEPQFSRDPLDVQSLMYWKGEMESGRMDGLTDEAVKSPTSAEMIDSAFRAIEMLQKSDPGFVARTPFAKRFEKLFPKAWQERIAPLLPK